MRFSGEFSYHCPLKINCGSHALAGLPMELTGHGAKQPLILVNSAHVGKKQREAVIDAFRSSGLTVAIYDQIPDPLAPDLLPLLLTLYRDGGCDSLIAVGGDSAVDAAKCLNMLVADHARGKKAGIEQHGGDTGSLQPLFLVATPGGNGYEATQYAHNGSGLVSTARLMPSVAIIDPVMMAGSQRAVVNGGLIGLAHAVEAFLDDTAGPLVHAHAHTAISLMMHYLPMAIDGAEYRQSLSGVVCAQIVAGCAFSAVSAGVCHALADYLTATTDLPPGYLMAIFLPHLLAETGRRHPDKVGALLYPMLGAQDFALTAQALQAPRVIALLWELYHALNQSLALGIPTALKNTGLTDDQLKKAHAHLTANADDDILTKVFRQAV